MPGTPLLANMTEFGKTDLISAEEFGLLGYQMVIFPVTALRVTLGGLKHFYTDLLAKGTQRDWMQSMMTRKELYELVNYEAYEATDAAWAALPD